MQSSECSEKQDAREIVNCTFCDDEARLSESRGQNEDMHINGCSGKQDARKFVNRPLLSDEVRLDEDQGRGGELHDKESYGPAGSVFALLVAIILMKFGAELGERPGHTVNKKINAAARPRKASQI